MRYYVPLVLIAALLLGCRSKPTICREGSPQAFEPMLVTDFGTRTTADSAWRIGVSRDSLDLSHMQLKRGPGSTSTVWTTDSPEGWKARGGWFVFVETPSKVWAYDGGAALYLLELNGDKGTLYVTGNLPCAPPQEVYSRVSIPVRREIDGRR